MEKKQAEKKPIGNKTTTPNPNRQKMDIKGYFRGIRTETKKVVWPTRKELGSYTVVVVFTCFAFGLGIWVVDSLFLGALKYILNISL
ncbi:MAG: preprotein translocase subunit SecE [Eubacteriales bacterium]